MLKLMLRAGLMLVTLGTTGWVQAAGYPTNGVVVGAAQLADQSILVLPLPVLPPVNALLGQLGQQQKIPQPALYVAPGASKAVAILLDCAQVEFNPSPPYFFWQEFVASGKGSDGLIYGIHMTSFSLISGGYYSSGWPFSYLLLSPAMRAKLPANLVTAVGLVDLQLSTQYGGLGYPFSDLIGQSVAVNATVSTQVASTRSTTNSCGVIDGNYYSDRWVQSGVFALVGTNGLPVSLPF